VFIGLEGKQEAVPLTVLGERARQMLVSRATKQVYLRLDAGVTAQDIMAVMDTLKDGGVEGVGIVALDTSKRTQN
jgi:biopolymer transport protein ExbD